MIKWDIVEGKRKYYAIYEIEKDMTKHYGEVIHCRKCGEVKFIPDDAMYEWEKDFYCSRACRAYKASDNKRLGLNRQ
jgi:hypothetical protein